MGSRLERRRERRGYGHGGQGVEAEIGFGLGSSPTRGFRARGVVGPRGLKPQAGVGRQVRIEPPGWWEGAGWWSVIVVGQAESTGRERRSVRPSCEQRWQACTLNRVGSQARSCAGIEEHGRSARRCWGQGWPAVGEWFHVGSAHGHVEASQEHGGGRRASQARRAGSSLRRGFSWRLPGLWCVARGRSPAAGWSDGQRGPALQRR